MTGATQGRTCPACGAPGARGFLTTSNASAIGEPYGVVVCDACGLRYTRPLPTPGELATLYGEEYYVNNKPRLASADFVRVLFERSVQWQHRRALLKRRPGRVLDVGCGNGEFLATLGARGWEVYGTEFSEAGCALARSKGITVHQGTLPSARFPDRFFDVVTLWHVLEHLPEPPVELAEIGRVLRDDGLLVVEVPNSDSLTFRLCGRRWYHLDLPRHLQHFTPTTLQRLLGQAGFAPSRRQDFHHWDFTASCYSFLARLGVLNRLGIHHFSTDYKQARPAAKAFFLALGLAVGLLCLPYSIAVTSLSRNGETVTVTARKVA